MSLSDLFADLDPKIAGPLSKITEALRTEIGQQIEGVRKDVRSLVGTDTEEPSEAPAPPAAPDGEGLDPLEELKLAAAAIDRSDKQASILTALLEGARRFSSRSAFVLIRDDGQRCWDSVGFEGTTRKMQGARVEVANGGSPWSHIQDGAGTRGLNAEECAGFCAQFEAPVPKLGALLPLSLGDHVAGYLYADGLGEEPLNITALQLLTFVAGQTLETLPVRKRSSTPALVVAGAEAAAPSVEEPAISDELPTLVEPPVEEEMPPAEPEPVEEEPPADDADLAEFDTESPTGLLETVPIDVEPEPEPEPAPEADFYEVAPPAEPERPPSLEEPPAEAAETAGMDVETMEETAPVEEPAPVIEPPVIEPPPVEPPVIEPPPVEPPPVEPVQPPAAKPAEPSQSSTQVVPPDDVLGPGWAFTARDNQEETGNEALHEEARRLARLLVTEIKLYNEEQVDQGRRSGDVYRRLQEDIDRSRQIFEDRIQDSVRAENDYFRDALIRILAGGDESLLGA